MHENNKNARSEKSLKNLLEARSVSEEQQRLFDLRMQKKKRREVFSSFWMNSLHEILDD